MTYEDEREELLRRVACGELSAEADEVRAWSGRDPAFASAVRSWVELTSGLDALGSERRAAEQAAAGLAEVPGADAVAPLVRRLSGATEAAAAPRPRRWPAWIALAAAAAVVLFLLRPWETGPAGPRGPGRTLEGSGALADLDPHDEVGAYGRFSWRCDAGKNDWFVVEVFPAEGGERVLASRELGGTEWTPTPDELARLPAEIRWVVLWHRADGSTDTAEAWARLSR